MLFIDGGHGKVALMGMHTLCHRSHNYFAVRLGMRCICRFLHLQDVIQVWKILYNYDALAMMFRCTSNHTMLCHCMSTTAFSTLCVTYLLHLY
jgi:hypothetical protein